MSKPANDPFGLSLDEEAEALRLEAIHGSSLPQWMADRLQAAIRADDSNQIERYDRISRYLTARRHR
ncbi:hypothetical protein NF699_09485 [Sphingomonadaceae bacterium OTU29LAMAA1]|jgi:hypothetical protein|nr:hypothetical protein NF699_09485 [Sphingomonadaceae bacterium OTU29LAMAA1]